MNGAGAFRDFRVMTSTNGWAWVNVTEGHGVSQDCCNFQKFEFEPKSSRYWKIELKHPWGQELAKDQPKQHEAAQESLEEHGQDQSHANITLSYIEFKFVNGVTEGFDIAMLTKCHSEEHHRITPCSQCTLRRGDPDMYTNLCTLGLLQEGGRVDRHLFSKKTCVTQHALSVVS